MPVVICWTQRLESAPLVQFVMRHRLGRLNKGDVVTDLQLVASIKQTEFASFIEAVADGQPFPTLPSVDQSYYLAYQGITSQVSSTVLPPLAFYFFPPIAA